MERSKKPNLSAVLKEKPWLAGLFDSLAKQNIPVGQVEFRDKGLVPYVEVHCPGSIIRIGNCGFSHISYVRGNNVDDVVPNGKDILSGIVEPFASKLDDGRRQRIVRWHFVNGLSRIAAKKG